MVSTYSEIRQKLDQGFTSARQLSVVLICFLLNIADGFDVISISMAAPRIAAEWGVSSSMLGLVLSSEMVGMTIGALFLSSVSDKFGRRPTIIGAISLVASAMILTALANNVTQLMVLRLVTGIGIGGVLVSAVSLASEFSPESKRNAVTIGMSTSFTVGSILAGPLISIILESSNWQNVFLFGGYFAVGLLLIAIFLLPESLEYLSNQNDADSKLRQKRLNTINKTLKSCKHESIEALVPEPKTEAIKAGSVRELLGKDYRTQTLQLWAICFLGYWLGYLIVKWLPKLLVNMEFDLSIGIYALTIYLVGGVVGSVIAAILSTRLDAKAVAKIALTVMGSLLLAFSLVAPTSITQLYIWLFVLGAIGTGGFNSIFAVCSSGYPSQLRASGFGYCIGIGRAGAILSPIVAGLLVERGWELFGLYLLLAMPAAYLCAFFVHRLRMHNEATT